MIVEFVEDASNWAEESLTL